MSKRLDGKVVIITGAASGIGKGTAELFAEEGAKLVLIDKDKQGLSEITNKVIEEYGVCEMVCGDVSSHLIIEQAVQLSVQTYGTVDVVFNNAGIMPTGNLLEFPEELWEQVMNVNVKSMFLMCKQVIPIMLKQGRGSIINTSSVMAVLTEPNHTAYTSSKAAIIGLTKEIAVTYAEHGIRCNSICPGWVDTEMNRKFAMDIGGFDKLYPIIKQQQPLGRMATIREVANAVLFLASDDSTAVSGSSLFVDGASSASI